MSNNGFNSIDERLMFFNHEKKVAGEMQADRAQKRREQEMVDSGGSVRNQIIAANSQKSIREGRKNSKAIKRMKVAMVSKGNSVEKLKKRSTGMMMNELWILTGSFVGFIPGYIGLHFMLAVSFFSDKVKLRLGDKIGIILVNVLLALLFAIFTAITAGIVYILTHPMEFVMGGVGEGLNIVTDTHIDPVARATAEAVSPVLENATVNYIAPAAETLGKLLGSAFQWAFGK